MARARGKTILLTAVAALGVGLSAAATGTAAQAAATRGRASAATVFPGGLADVSAASSTDAWAVGSGRPGRLILHWNGTAWSTTSG